MRRFGPLAAFLLPLLLFSSRSEHDSCQHKFDLIEGERLRPGSKITLSQRELNAYAVVLAEPDPVPEPASAVLLLAGLGIAGVFASRKFSFVSVLLPIIRQSCLMLRIMMTCLSRRLACGAATLLACCTSNKANMTRA